MSVLRFTRYFVEFVIAWEKQIVVVVWFLLSFFGRLPIGEVMGLIYFKLYQLELHHLSQLIFHKDLPSFQSITETWGNPLR